MKDKHEIILYLRIMEFDCDPDEITSALGVMPSKVWRKGELMNDYSPRIYKRNGWRIDSGVDRYRDFNDHLQALFDIIEPNVEAFKAVCSQYYTDLSCAVYMYHSEEESSIPWIHFDKRATRILGMIGAEIDFDMYTLPGD